MALCMTHIVRVQMSSLVFHIVSNNHVSLLCSDLGKDIFIQNGLCSKCVHFATWNIFLMLFLDRQPPWCLVASFLQLGGALNMCFDKRLESIHIATATFGNRSPTDKESKKESCNTGDNKIMRAALL